MNPFSEGASTVARASASASAGASGSGLDVHALADELARDARVEDGRAGEARGERDDGGAGGDASSRDDRVQRGNGEAWDVGDARARKPREVSAEERINATATAVIKAGSSSGHSVEAFNGSSDDMAFSDRLALATAKISTLAAQLKEKTASAREARAKEKALGGKELLRRLQETASSQSAQRAPGLVSLQSMRRGEDAAAPSVDASGKAVKGLGYKLSAATRRTSQRLLQSFGTAEKMRDDEFKTLWNSVQQQESILKEIAQVSAAYKDAQRAVFDNSKRLATLIRSLVETGDKNNVWEGAPTVAREAAMREACKMVDVADALVARCTPLTEEVFDWNILEPAAHRSKELPAYKACVAKRAAYMQDMDAFDRQLGALQKRAPKNADEYAVKEEQARRAKERFQDFSSKLVEELSNRRRHAIRDGVLARPRVRQRPMLQSRAPTRRRPSAPRWWSVADNSMRALARVYKLPLQSITNIVASLRRVRPRAFPLQPKLFHQLERLIQHLRLRRVEFVNLIHDLIHRSIARARVQHVVLVAREPSLGELEHRRARLCPRLVRRVGAVRVARATRDGDARARAFDALRRARVRTRDGGERGERAGEHRVSK